MKKRGKKSGNSNKNKELLMTLVIIAIILAAFFVILKFEVGITGNTVEGKTYCKAPVAALKFINDKGCMRISEDPKCEESGKVEIKC